MILEEGRSQSLMYLPPASELDAVLDAALSSGGALCLVSCHGDILHIARAGTQRLYGEDS